jgi:serine/threonine-protein kinase RsbT
MGPTCEGEAQFMNSRGRVEEPVLPGGDSCGEVKIDAETDIVAVRKVVREVASKLGFGVTDSVRIVTAASELARNVYKYAGRGVMTWQVLHDGRDCGIELRFEDHGPGITEVEEALREGYSTGGGLGLGLPGAKKLMDEMDISSAPGQGTTVTVRRWRWSNSELLNY